MYKIHLIKGEGITKYVASLCLHTFERGFGQTSEERAGHRDSSVFLAFYLFLNEG